MKYYTQSNEVLDAICWKHYLQLPNYDLLGLELGEVAEQRGLGLELINPSTGILDGSVERLDQLVNLVLEFNPHLASYGPHLPSGVEIKLPNAEQVPTNSSLLNLWK